ncbi:MAG: hypothetical protein ACXVIG_00690 [Halobacteriota archaeon]
MLQLLPGLLYVIVITAVFTALLISFTAVFLLTQARAVVRKRYLGPVFSKGNTWQVLKLRPLLITIMGVLICVRDEGTRRSLITFKRPAELRLYDKFFYCRPFFSSGAYLIPLKDTLETSFVNNTLTLIFEHDDREITIRCKSYGLVKWRETLNRLISDHK